MDGVSVEVWQRRPHQIPDDQGERSGVARLHGACPSHPKTYARPSLLRSMSRSQRAVARHLKVAKPVHEEIDRFLCGTRRVLVVARLAELFGCFPQSFAACREARQKRHRYRERRRRFAARHISPSRTEKRGVTPPTIQRMTGISFPFGLRFLCSTDKDCYGFREGPTKRCYG